MTQTETFLSVATPPGPPEVTYYETIERIVSITNLNDKVPVYIKKILLNFQSDSGIALWNYDCQKEIAPNQVLDFPIPIKPDTRFRPNTNLFSGVVDYRLVSDIKRPLTHEMSSNYIIIKEPHQTLGQLFISYKQPDDESYKNSLNGIVRRAGFTPWSIDHDYQMGEDFWKGIEEAIKNSKGVLFIWTQKTVFAKGVHKEIEICRKYNIPEVLLLEDEEEVPSFFQSTPYLYKHFPKGRPSEVFADVIDNLRTKEVSSKVVTIVKPFSKGLH